MTGWGAAVSRIRRRQGVTVETLAHAQGIDLRSMERQLRRMVRPPPPDRARATAEALGVPLARIMVAAGYHDLTSE